jgi:DNA-binding CsgD family transcriptional regulator
MSDTIDQIDDRLTVQDELARLTERERRVLTLRYGLGGAGEHTYREIGAIEGCSTERIRQIENQSLKKLKTSRSMCMGYLDQFSGAWDVFPRGPRARPTPAPPVGLRRCEAWLTRFRAIPREIAEGNQRRARLSWDIDHAPDPHSRLSAALSDKHEGWRLVALEQERRRLERNLAPGHSPQTVVDYINMVRAQLSSAARRSSDTLSRTQGLSDVTHDA